MAKKIPSEEGKRRDTEDITGEEVVRMSRITDSIPMDELPRIWHELNRYEWAEELGEKPADFKENSTNCLEQRFFMQEIELKCGWKAISRYKHTAELGYTDQQFEDWWESFTSRQLKEEQQELYDRYCKGNEGNNERKDCGFSVESAFFFTVGFLVATIIFCFIRYVTAGG